MGNTGFDFAKLRDADKATGYAAPNYSTVADGPGSALASGSMYSTTGDLYKFHRAMKLYRLLPEDWQDLAYTPFKDHYALGWETRTMYHREFLEQGGSTPGFSSLVMSGTKDDLFIAILENTGHLKVSPGMIADSIIAVLYAPKVKKHHPKERHFITSRNTLKKYVGEFDFSPTFYFIFSLKGNRLVAESPNHDGLELEAESPVMFRIKGSMATVQFLHDPHGEVNKIILRQDGQKATGIRIR